MDQTAAPWMDRASQAATAKTFTRVADSHSDVLQAYALLAIAESITRLARAIETTR